jgi:hypothetical protein
MERRLPPVVRARLPRFFSLRLLAVAGSTEERPAAEIAAGAKSLLVITRNLNFFGFPRDFLSSNESKDSISEADCLRRRQ